MTYIVVHTLWPFSKREELIKKVIEAMKKYPEDNSIAEEKVSATKSTLEGINTMTIWEVKKGKLEEALERIGNTLAIYAVIEGFTYHYETWLTQIEAYSRIGRTPPE